MPSRAHLKVSDGMIKKEHQDKELSYLGTVKVLVHISHVVSNFQWIVLPSNVVFRDSGIVFSRVKRRMNQRVVGFDMKITTKILRLGFRSFVWNFPS